MLTILAAVTVINLRLSPPVPSTHGACWTAAMLAEEKDPEDTWHGSDNWEFPKTWLLPPWMVSRGDEDVLMVLWGMSSIDTPIYPAVSIGIQRWLNY